MTFWCAGYRNVTAAYGVEGFTADHLAAFKRFDISRVVIAFDRDEAGERGAAKIAAQLMAEGIDCYRVQFPKGMDANDYALEGHARRQIAGRADPQGRVARRRETPRRRPARSPTTCRRRCVSAPSASAAKEIDAAPIIEPETDRFL